MSLARTSPRPARPPSAEPEPAPATATTQAAQYWNRPRTVLAVVVLLALHLTLAVRSLVRENPTVDEVIHLPAGVTYWQKGTFRLYHHNPPLFKLLAAWPVAGPNVVIEPLYDTEYWRSEPPNKSGFAHEFMRLNAAIYFELFNRSRLLMPLFSLVGALAVFAWSRRLYGVGGGLLSLALWVLCPNILAHARLITSDVSATSLGVLATFVFSLYLKHPTWRRTILAGLCLGLAQLTKFSLLLLYGIWPLLWLIQEVAAPSAGRWRRVGRSVAQGLTMVVFSVFVIDVGYGFEGVGQRLGSYQFVSEPLTRTRDQPLFHVPRPKPWQLEARIQEYRVNRFQGTWLGALPTPLPRHYMLGFDDQKLEADGVWQRFLVPAEQGDHMGPEGDAKAGYPVYLDGTLQQKSWSYYYLLALVYKVPEGTWALLALSWVVLAVSPRARASWLDELTLLIVPVVVLVIMSLFTNINLGLRYVLPIFPYLFIATGKVVPWASGIASRTRRLAAAAVIGAALAATTVATLSIHPSYLAYFNLISGGPAHGSEHLIDSNLDWGQDLVNLKQWVDANAPNEPIGLAYFGQINPDIFLLRSHQGNREPPLNWYLPPPLPGGIDPPPPRYRGGVPPPKPGLYAVSVSLMRGLPWRVYDAGSWAPWNAKEKAFAYFRQLKPIATVGNSIFLYRLTEDDAKRLAPLWSGA
ncbi:MAG: glycosyltransferase family 39 protein [Isosphaeraceae bacterium]|nr:glycosyltransferase family 39 protein [Isosphaeraceae bacterium]